MWQNRKTKNLKNPFATRVTSLRIKLNFLLLLSALYAKRKTLTRQPYPPQNEVYFKKFEDLFRYEATPDQLNYFETVEKDMVVVLLWCKIWCQGAFLSPMGVLVA